MTTASWAVIVASGKDEMLNEEVCTAFLSLQSRPVLSYSLAAFERCPEIEGVVVVVPRDRLEQVISIVQLFGCHKVKKIVPGGATQFASFTNGLKYVDEDAGIILMHEASRPILASSEISELVKASKRNGLAVLGKAVDDEAALVTGRAAAVDKLLDAGSVWILGSPVAMTSDVLGKTQAMLKKKRKTVKKLSEATALANLKPRLVGASQYPSRISSIETLQRMDRLLAGS